MGRPRKGQLEGEQEWGVKEERPRRAVSSGGAGGESRTRLEPPSKPAHRGAGAAWG